ncbi:MAG: lactoylglutathione lyase [Burkholderiales bacterium RIFCSPLOWO2_02_FULL_57_36]|nr:MAG: lactoylglutathione lyase [Burkholderiales bacterium RIFCSPLOWO2_02_FULL_57_36]
MVAPSAGPVDLLGARMLHTMLRVRDLDTSIAFYTRSLGMRLLRRTDFPDGQFTLAFVGYGEESNTAVLELTHNWDHQDYAMGSAYGHIAIGVSDVAAAARALAAAGVNVTRPAGPLKGDPNEIIAFIEDPDGYKVELIQRK